DFAEPWGSWQAVQPCFSSGACLTVAFAALATRASWQVAQSWPAGFTRVKRFAEAWGSWQLTQLASSTGLWVRFARAGTIWAWQVRQTFPLSSASSLPWLDACGLWHPVHFWPRTGVCRNGFCSCSLNCVWQARQFGPSAPGLSLNADVVAGFAGASVA